MVFISMSQMEKPTQVQTHLSSRIFQAHSFVPFCSFPLGTGQKEMKLFAPSAPVKWRLFRGRVLGGGVTLCRMKTGGVCGVVDLNFAMAPGE